MFWIENIKQHRITYSYINNNINLNDKIMGILLGFKFKKFCFDIQNTSKNLPYQNNLLYCNGLKKKQKKKQKTKQNKTQHVTYNNKILGRTCNCKNTSE